MGPVLFIRIVAKVGESIETHSFGVMWKELLVDEL